MGEEGEFGKAGPAKPQEPWEFNFLENKYFPPAPTGIPATDTSNLQSTLIAASKTKGVTHIESTGTYAINKELIRPFNVSMVIGQNVTLQAVAPFEGDCLLSDSKTEKSIGQSIIGGGILDANNIVNHALWCRYFGHQLVLGVKPKNSLKSDCILGDNEATGTSQEPVITPDFLIQRDVGPTPVGHYCFWAQNASDGRLLGNVVTGQEVGFRFDKGGWRGFGIHPTGAGFPMQVCVEDNAGCEIFGANFDTPTPNEHVAVGEAATSVITDAKILKQHEGRPVTGVNVPANSCVGTVTSGVSFILKHAETGAEVKPTGAVASVTLLGVGFLGKVNGWRISGGKVFVISTYGVDNGCVGITATTNIATSNAAIDGFEANGGGAEFRVNQAIYGKLAAMNWTGLIERNCVNPVVPSTQQRGLVGLEVGVPAGLAVRAEGAEIQPSISKPTSVSGFLKGAALTRTKIKLLVEGVPIFEISISAVSTGITFIPFSFIVPTGGKYKWEKIEGTVEEVKTSHTAL